MSLPHISQRVDHEEAVCLGEGGQNTAVQRKRSQGEAAAAHMGGLAFIPCVDPRPAPFQQLTESPQPQYETVASKILILSMRKEAR